MMMSPVPVRIVWYRGVIMLSRSVFTKVVGSPMLAVPLLPRTSEPFPAASVESG